nr:DNA methyltransferase [Melghirimyces algeriensis]
MPAGFFHTCVTSPPYWGLRDYGQPGQIGLEDTPEEYIEKIVEVFREVRRVLRDDGTLWLNLGDSYAQNGRSTNNKGFNERSGNASGQRKQEVQKPKRVVPDYIKIANKRINRVRQLSLDFKEVTNDKSVTPTSAKTI